MQHRFELRGARFALSALAFCLGAHAIHGAEPSEVLLLIPDTPGRHFTTPIFNGIESVLAQSFGSDVAIAVEEVPLPDPAKPELVGLRREWLRNRYAGHRLDLIFAVHGVALDAVHELQAEVWPDVPIVFTYSAYDPPKLGIPPHSTGRILEFNPQATLELGRQLFPEAAKVYLIGGSGAMDKAFNSKSAEALRSTGPHLEFVDLSGLSLAEIKARLRAAPAKVHRHHSGGFEGQRWKETQLDSTRDFAWAGLSRAALCHLRRSLRPWDRRRTSGPVLGSGP